MPLNSDTVFSSKFSALCPLPHPSCASADVCSLPKHATVSALSVVQDIKTESAEAGQDMVLLVLVHPAVPGISGEATA